MTERGPRAPDPAEPSNPDGPPATASRPPADLGEVRRTDAIIESLAARRAAGSGSRCGPDAGRPRPDDPDPAVRLLHALITDVDDPGPERAAGPDPSPPCPPAPSGPGSGPRRRGPRTIVALGVAGAVLASTGVAAAGGGMTDHSAAAPAPRPTAGTSDDAERTVRADTDTDAGTHEHSRVLVRAVPEPERPTPAPTPSDGPGGREEPKQRPNHPFPFGSRPRHPDGPAVTVRSDPGGGSDTPSGDARRLDDLRERVQKYIDQHNSPRGRDD